MQLQRLGHVAICVNDIEKAAAFYQHLGMELAWKDSDWAYLKAGKDGLSLLSPNYEQAGPHFGFVFDDRSSVDTAYERLKEEGVRVSEIHEHRDGTASFYQKFGSKASPPSTWLTSTSSLRQAQCKQCEQGKPST